MVNGIHTMSHGEHCDMIYSVQYGYCAIPWKGPFAFVNGAKIYTSI